MIGCQTLSPDPGGLAVPYLAYSSTPMQRDDLSGFVNPHRGSIPMCGWNSGLISTVCPAVLRILIYPAESGTPPIWLLLLLDELESCKKSNQQSRCPLLFRR